MTTKHDCFGRAVTRDKYIASKFRVIDKNDTSMFTKSQHSYTKYINMYHTYAGEYFLPPSIGVYFKPNSIISPLDTAEKYNLRDHQQAVVNFVQQQITEGKRSCFIESKTGSGKTYMLLGVCALLRGKAIIGVPTKAIGQQIVDTISQYYSCGRYSKTSDYDIAVVCHMTLNTDYEIINGAYDVLLLDELHNLPKKRIEQIVMWRGSFVFGCTATPIRKEFGIEGFQMLLGGYYNTGLETLPIKVYSIRNDIKITIQQFNELSGGLAPESPEILRRVVTLNEDRNNLIVRLVKRLWSIGLTKLIFFSDRVQHLETLSTLIGEESILFYGKSNIVEARKKAEALDKYVILGNIKSCGEGFDLPELQCGILGVSTTRVKSIVQMAGRMVRPYEGKDAAYFIDISDTLAVGQSRKKPLGHYQRKKIYREMNWETNDISVLATLMQGGKK